MISSFPQDTGTGFPWFPSLVEGSLAVLLRSKALIILVSPLSVFGNPVARSALFPGTRHGSPRGRSRQVSALPEEEAASVKPVGFFLRLAAPIQLDFLNP